MREMEEIIEKNIKEYSILNCLDCLFCMSEHNTEIETGVVLCVHPKHLRFVSYNIDDGSTYGDSIYFLKPDVRSTSCHYYTKDRSL